MTLVDLFKPDFVSLDLKHTHTLAHPLIQRQSRVLNPQTAIVMSEPQNQGEGTTTQETSSPKIEITPVATESIFLRRLSVLKLDPTPGKEEQDATPQASAALPETPAAEEKTADATISSVPDESGTTNQPSADPPMKSTVESSTQPKITKFADETVPATVALDTGVAKVSKTWTLLILAT